MSHNNAHKEKYQYRAKKIEKYLINKTLLIGLRQVKSHAIEKKEMQMIDK